MRGAAMSFTAAACGFVVFLLSVSGVQGWYGWGVTCTSTEICALEGSTVEMSCTYPTRDNNRDTTVEETFWFTKLKGNVPVDLRTEYSGRVQYSCSQEKRCTLRIRDLRESDSAEYKFRFLTNQPAGTYPGSPGVTLSVTALQVQVNKISDYSTYAELKCHSSCRPAGRLSYFWFKNGQKVGVETSIYKGSFNAVDFISCALKGHENYGSPSVCVHGQNCNRVTYSDRSICAFKGSSVDISCTYNSYHRSINAKFWFSPGRSDRWQRPSQPEDLRKDSLYAGRVQVFDTDSGHSTLRITDLRESDSAQYHFKFKTPWFEWRNISPGTTLTVTDPDLQLQVIQSSTGPKLICHSSCLSDRSSFVWYKNETEIREETSPFYRGHISPADHYSCAYQNYRSASVYAPKLPSVSVRPSGEIVENSAVTLTCSSDANPAAKYTWYKKNGDPDPRSLSKEAELVFRSIQSSGSGEYYCTAENELGRRTSESISIDVKYAPKLPSVSVSPSGEIVENSSVSLNCSSDANPAANYTWYKKNQTLGPGPQDKIYHFTSINSKNSGVYHCKSENQYGQINSSSVFIDVLYAPKLPSVSVSPSGEIVEGSSVNLTCSSDANPAAKYTWYKENEDSPKASGQIFTITDFRPEHSGNYYCDAQNRRGRHNSTLHLIVVAGAWKSAAAGMVSVVLLLVILLSVFLWMRRNKSLTQTSKAGERPDNSAQLHISPLYGNMLAVAQRQPEAEEDDDLNYSSIQFSLSQQEALYSNYRPAQPHRGQTEDEDEEEGVDYTPVKTDNNSSTSGTRCQEDGEDLFALYSTVNKNNLNTT